MKLLLLTFPLILVAAGIIVFANSRRPAQAVHYHAGFTVYVNGVKQDYSDIQYMSLDVCKVGSQQSSVDEAKETAHLHDLVGDVVHVHKPGVTWSDLFRNMGVSFPAGEPVYGYRNGTEINDIMHQVIGKYDSVIIMVGSRVAVKPSDYVTKSHIEAVETSSEFCGR